MRPAESEGGAVHLLVDSWVPLGVPLELLSPLACLRLRLFGAFAHRAHRPNAPLPPDKRDALQVRAPPLGWSQGRVEARGES